MKGCNEIRICQAQMIDIVQHYFNTVLFAEGKSPAVNGICHDSTYGFSIKVVESEAK